MTFPFSKDNDEKSKSILANIPGFDSVIGWMTKVLQGDAGSFSQVVDWAYGVAINADLPGVSSAQELADEYTAKGKNLEDAVDKRLEDQKRNFHGYGTDQEELLRNAIIMERGSYFFYAVSDQAEQWEEVFLSCIR